MPVLTAADAVVHEAHGSRFVSYAAPSRGSRELCAWRLEVPAGARGTAHRPTREEVLLVLGGRLDARLDGRACTLGPGEVLLVPPGSELVVDAGPDGATAWVTSTPGLEAVLADGTRLAPPWAG